MRTPLLAAAFLLLACGRATSDAAPRPADRGVVLGAFEGAVDPATGAVTLRATPAAPRQRALVVVGESAGTPGTVSVTSAGPGAILAGGCGGPETFQGVVEVRSFFPSSVLQDVYLQLESVSPSGHEACNGVASAEGLDGATGLFSYGTLGLAGGAGDRASRTWQLALPDRARFTFRGRVHATVAGGLALFEAGNPWNTPVSSAAVSADSGAVLGWLAANGGFGTGAFRIDFSMQVLQADASTPRVAFTRGASFWDPDCDQFPFPLPAGGAVEGNPGYACADGGDCHLLVVDRGAHRLYEMYQADVSGGVFTGGCAVQWDLLRAYPPELRGDQCTSTDAAGLPVAALLFSADEVAAGSIDHAIRFILPNERMRAGVFVRPATHAGRPTGPAGAPPYGARLRLRPDYPLASLPGDGARVIARALQRYGMILADGGNIALTAQSDRFTAHAWSEVGVDAYSLSALQPGDFEVIDAGPAIPLTYDCVRNGL